MGHEVCGQCGQFIERDWILGFHGLLSRGFSGGAADEVEAIFSAAFGVEHGHVGFFEEFFEVFGVGGEGGQSAADSQGAFAFGADEFEGGLLEFPAEPLGHEDRLAGVFQPGITAVATAEVFGQARVFFARQIPEHHRKLVAAETGDDVVAAAAVLDHSAGLLKDVIADGVAVSVVVMLKVVNVKNQQRNAKLVTDGQFEYLREKLTEIEIGRASCRESV